MSSSQNSMNIIENKASLQLPNNYNKENKDEEIGLKEPLYNSNNTLAQEITTYWLFLLLIFIYFMQYFIEFIQEVTC